MKHFIQFFAIFNACFSLLLANDYEDGWAALKKNDRNQARKYFQKALEDPATATDAAISIMYLDEFDGNDKSLEGQKAWLSVFNDLEDINPYLFALWHKEPLGGRGKIESKKSVDFLLDLQKNPKLNGSLGASLAYKLGTHYLFSADLEESKKRLGAISNLNNWQFTGPFENASWCGFDKNYAPIAHPEPSANFKSKFNADIAWFTPEESSSEGWVIPFYNIKNTNAIIFAQSFINSDTDKEVVLGLGFRGNIKVWVNDQLIISEFEYRVTDFDAYQANCKLKKGSNRVLVQIGCTSDDNYNFALRFTDQNGHSVSGLSSSATYSSYPNLSSIPKPALNPFYAETYFTKKIDQKPDNLINYLLLTEVYLRNQKGEEALGIMEKANKLAPNSSIIRYYLIQALMKLENRTAYTQETAKLRELDPDCFLSMYLDVRELEDNEKFEEATTKIEQMGDLFGKLPYYYTESAKIYAQNNRIEDLLKVIEIAYQKYPSLVTFVKMKYNVETSLKKSPAAGIAILETYMKKNYNYEIHSLLLSAYFDQGENEKALKLMKQADGLVSGDSDPLIDLAKYYYGIKDYKKAKEYNDRALGISPYLSSYWENEAAIQRGMGDEEEAVFAYKKALEFNANSYDARESIRQIQHKPSLTSYLPEIDIYSLIKKSKSETKQGEHDFYYILNDYATILYSEGASESYHTIAVRVLNDAGVDYWKETSIGYNVNMERLILEKAEVVKENGDKVKAETNENEIVFPNLKIGDVVWVKYRIVGYTTGKISREHWDNFFFDTFMPQDLSRYTLLYAKNLPLKFEYPESDSLTFSKKEVEDFVLCTWEAKDVPALKRQRTMPTLSKVGRMLTFSTVPDWNFVANWYSDISATQAKSDYETARTLKTIFPEGMPASELEKAEKIYRYIVDNISYSSVSFRQSGYVPQRASKVIQTRLGDCKDVSTLYATLAREAGLKANLVLLGTRNTDSDDVLLPSVTFNHCIVKVVADNKNYYLELTDADLPFSALPPDDLGGLALEIPSDGETTSAKVFLLHPESTVPNMRLSKSVISPVKNDLKVSMKNTLTGCIASDVRKSYKTLSPQKKQEELQGNIAKRFKNTVVLNTQSFSFLEDKSNDPSISAEYTVKNEVIEIGGMKTFQIPFYYWLFRSDNFISEDRKYDVDYASFEETDIYTDSISVVLEAGKKFVETPENVHLSFNEIQYDLEYVLISDTELRVNRQVKTARKTISKEQYGDFLAFIEQVLNVEKRYIAFK